jgi:hypothetical protein
MKFHYTILKISPNTASGDAISIGLLAYDSTQAKIIFSERRKNLVKRLVSPDLVDFICKQILNKINDLNKISSKKRTSFFPDNLVLEPSYVDYLSNYSNGVFQVSKSNVFLKELNDDNLKLLFENIIDKIDLKTAKPHKASTANRIVEQKLINRVKDKVHTNIKVDNALIPSLFYSFDMDCIGKNGVFVGAKTMDFEQSKQTIDKQISHYTNLIATLSINYQKQIKDNHFYLIAEEPNQQKSDSHEIWDAIQKNDFYKIINPEESELVAIQIEKSKASKFFK